MNGAARSWDDTDASAALRGARTWIASNAWLLASVAVVSFGIWLRSRHMFHEPISVWADEAQGANELMRGQLLKPSVRPVGFMVATHWLASIFGPTEATIRFIPWLSGVLGAVVAIPLAGRLFQSPAIRLLFIAILALHPFTIDFSREFKPYSTSVLIHSTCLWCALSYWQTRAIRWALVGATVAWFGVLFAQDVIFLFPGFYLSAAIAAWRTPDKRVRHLLALSVATLLTLALLGVLYWFLWQHMSGPQNASKGKAFGYYKAFFSPAWDYFWSPASGHSRLQWLSGKIGDIASFPGYRRSWWPQPALFSTATFDALVSIDRAIWISLAAVGFVRIAYRGRVQDLLLLVLPIVVAAALNLKLLWPFALIRTNLFMLVYTSALACLALDTTDPVRARHWSRIAPVLLLVIAPLLLFERTWHRIKEITPSGGLLHGVQALLELQGPARPTKPETLILDGWARDPWDYYNRTHPGHRELFAELRTRFRAHSSKSFGTAPLALARRVVGHDPERFWLLVANPHYINQLKAGTPPGYRVIARKVFEDDLALVVALQREPYVRREPHVRREPRVRKRRPAR